MRRDGFLAVGFLQQGREDSLQRPHQNTPFLFLVLAVVDIEALFLKHQQLLNGSQHGVTRLPLVELIQQSNNALLCSIGPS